MISLLKISQAVPLAEVNLRWFLRAAGIGLLQLSQQDAKCLPPIAARDTSLRQGRVKLHLSAWVCSRGDLRGPHHYATGCQTKRDDRRIAAYVDALACVDANLCAGHAGNSGGRVSGAAG